MRPVLTRSLVIVGLVTSLGAAPPPNPAAPPPNPKTSSQPVPKAVRPAHHARAHARAAHRPYQVGHASWYGKKFHGKKTASGERYDMFQFTAAHPALPLGTLVRVTNLRNHRWVVVRVNDRGPVPRSRVIDLSYGAAQMLELKEPGVERVRLDLIETQTVAEARTEQVGME